MLGQGKVLATIGLEYNRSKHKRYWLTTLAVGKGGARSCGAEYPAIPPDSWDFAVRASAG
jgi:hypothetical protein